MNQQATLEAIKQDSGVSMGVKNFACLHRCVGSCHGATSPNSSSRSVAGESSGSRKLVLCVGCDGIALRHRLGFFEVAATATLSVYDRAGKRLGTIYLASPPGKTTAGSMDPPLVPT